MTRLAICRKCRKIFFTNIKRNYKLRCPQRNCRNNDVKAWSAKLINQLGSDILLDLFPRPRQPEQLQAIRTPPPKKAPKPKKKPGGQKKELRPGTIGHFHRKYRQYKEQHPDQEPRAYMVSEWLRDGKTSKKVRDRWALELLEKHKPEQ